MNDLRAAQRAWAQHSVHQRASVIRAALPLVRRENRAFLEALGRESTAASLTAEIWPLLAAMRFAGKEANVILAPRRVTRRGTPPWLWGTRAQVERRPFGIVLIIGPANYPLMLPGIQVVQALVAGNAVAIKPAPGCTHIMRLFVACLNRAGVPEGLIDILDEDAGPAASRAGYDLIVLTGSERSGRAVAQAAAETLTPTIMELSGADPVFVLPGADIGRVVRALLFGARLNNGATCIAPRRIFAQRAMAQAIERRLLRALARRRGNDRPELSGLARDVVAAGGRARQAGGVLVCAGPLGIAPILARDLFAPWLGIIGVATMQDALLEEQMARFALGASIFGPEHEAHALAAQLPGGSICINDLIVPTADPRLPFGGARASGWGVTRGREGLLAMTRPVAVSVRRRFAWHLMR